MDSNGSDEPKSPVPSDESPAGREKLDLGDLVVVDQKGHPYNCRTGKVIGRRGEYAPGDPWLMVLVDLERRCFLFPQSMLRLQNRKDN
ncbi:MAG: hypothetical protein HPY50_07080 [Firmicutes bacterium]|nr:hypothetical protein [Bacillota bacterium]